MRGRLAGGLLAIAAAAAIGASGAGPASAATGRALPAGIFSISPGDHQLFGLPGALLTPTVVGNSTGVRLPVRVVPVLVHETRSGAFTYGTSPSQLGAARRVLAVSTPGFSLAGHTRETVLERWRPGTGRHAVYAGVVFRAIVPGERRGVRTIDQLLGLDLLGIHGSPPARGRTTGLSASDGTGHRLSFTVSLQNVGGSFATPTTVAVRIRSATGQTIRARMTPGVILPGVDRDFVTQLPARLRRGSYVAVSEARLGRTVTRRFLHFSVTADGLLPAPSLLAGVVDAGGTVGRSATVTVALRNQGTRAGAPHGTVALYPVRDGAASRTPAAIRPLRGAALAPGHAATERLRLGHLRGGPYEVVITYRAPFAPSQPAIVPFTPRPSSTVVTAVGGWVATNVPVVVVTLLALVAGGYATRRIRRAESRPHGRIRLRPLP